MQGSRWGRRLGPGLAALVAILAIASTTIGAPSMEGRPPPVCAGTESSDARGDGSGWFRLEPTLDGGRRVGQRLALGLGRGRAWAMPLDAESFATGPTDGRVVAGTDDGSTSTLSIVDLRRGCRSTTAVTTDVVRSALLGADGRTVFEHRVDRSDRRDLGVWRRSPGRDAVRILPPPDPDPAFGRTWLTELRWAGRRLIVASCGEVACRFRELDPLSGAVRSLADPTLGSLVGVTGDALVARGACRGLPCPVLVADLTSGTVTTLDAAVGAAVLVTADGLPRVVIDAVDGHALRSISLDGDVTSLADGDPAVDLAGPRSELGMELPPGWIPFLGADGPLARRFDAAAIRRLDEVRP